jgi:hypothetical protein
VFVDLDADVDQETIKALISQLSTLSTDRTLETDVELEVIGLEEPAHTLKLQ